MAEKIRSSEITPEEVYVSRRKFMQGVGALALGSAVLAACGGQDPATVVPGAASPAANNGNAGGTGNTKDTGNTEEPTPGVSEATTDELGDSLTPFEAVINYNNFYEFTTNKEKVAPMAAGFVTEPWTVAVGGLVQNPQTYGIEDLRKFDQEERIYRLRCVEGWSMVIPWLGFPLARLLQDVEPLGNARYVRFETIYDPDRLPGQQSAWYEWPYIEGLHLDEAMNDLAILSTGLYGKELLPQNGAPLRLVVPWKYGFKSIKSIVKIDLVEEMPTSLWMAAAPHEYGFYANVNPQVAHPRWSQASERRIGEFGRRDTLMFNGYTDEVAGLYAEMDLSKNY